MPFLIIQDYEEMMYFHAFYGAGKSQAQSSPYRISARWSVILFHDSQEKQQMMRESRTEL